MINKEVLSAVLSKKVLWVQDVVAHNDILFDAKYTNEVINIYELLHRCKCFLNTKGYSIRLLLRDNGLVTLKLHYGVDYDYTKVFNIKNSAGCIITSELEAALKACEWVLQQLKENDERP